MERRTENRLRQRNRMRNHWCPAKRLAAFVLSFAMLVVNIGNSAAVAMAAEGNSRHVEFQMNQEDIWTAAKEAVSAGIGISAESFNFAQGDLEGIGELFAGGQLFEITNEVKYNAYPDTEGAELRVFIRIPGDGDPGSYRFTGKEKLIFMYMNSGEGDLNASVKIVGAKTGEIVVNTGKICVESYQEAFGGSDEKENEENLTDQTIQMEPVQGNQNNADKEMEGGTGRGEMVPGEEITGNEETAASEETTAGEETMSEEGSAGEDTMTEEESSAGEPAGETELGTEEGTDNGSEDGTEEGPDSTEQETLDNAAASGEEVSELGQGNDDISSETAAEDKSETEAGEAIEENGDSHGEESAEGTAGEVSAEKSETAEKEEAEPDHNGGDVKEPEKAGSAEEKSGEAGQDSDRDSKKGEESAKDDSGASDNRAGADNSSDTSGGDEEGQKLSKSNNQVRIVAESAWDKDGLVAVGENTTARVIVMELSATGFVAEAAEEVLEEEIPEEVKKFLEAVGELPAPETVTKENAEEIGEKVNAVIELWEGLDGLELGYEEREDVSAAMEVVYAVLEKVLEAEEIEDGAGYIASGDSLFSRDYHIYDDNVVDELNRKTLNLNIKVGVGETWIDEGVFRFQDMSYGVYHVSSWDDFDIWSTNEEVLKVTAVPNGKSLKIIYEGIADGTAQIKMAFNLTTISTGEGSIWGEDNWGAAACANCTVGTATVGTGESITPTPEPEGDGFRQHEIYMPVGSTTFLNIQSPGYSYYGDLYKTLIPNNNCLTTSSTDHEVATISATRDKSTYYTTFKAEITAGNKPGIAIVSAKYDCRVQKNGFIYYQNLGFNNLVDDFIVHVYDPETVTIMPGKTHDFKYPEVPMTDFSESLLRTVPYVDDTDVFEITRKNPSTPSDTVPTGQMTFTVKANKENKSAMAGAEAVFAKDIRVAPGGDTQWSNSYTVYVYQVNLKSEKNGKTQRWKNGPRDVQDKLISDMAGFLAG